MKPVTVSSERRLTFCSMLLRGRFAPLPLFFYKYSVPLALLALKRTATKGCPYKIRLLFSDFRLLTPVFLLLFPLLLLIPEK